MEVFEHALIFRPFAKQFVDVAVVTEFLQEGIDLQGFKLRLTEIGIAAQLRIIKVEELLGQLLIAPPDCAPVVGVEIQKRLEEGEVLTDRLLSLRHFLSPPPKTPREGR